MLVLEYGFYRIPSSFASSAKRVLDVGCGTGIWSKEFAQKHSQASVLGVDISPPTKDAACPPNCDFRRLNIEGTWNIPEVEEGFDFIHARLLVCGIRQWDAVFSEIYRHVRPGGYFQIIDIRTMVLSAKADINDDTPCGRWNRCIYETGRQMGADYDAPMKHCDRLRKAGFNIIEDELHRLYVDPAKWGGPEKDTPEHIEAGRLCVEAVRGYIENTEENLIRLNRMSRKEGREMVRQAKEEWVRDGSEKGLHVQ